MIKATVLAKRIDHWLKTKISNEGSFNIKDIIKKIRPTVILTIIARIDKKLAAFAPKCLVTTSNTKNANHETHIPAFKAKYSRFTSWKDDSRFIPTTDKQKRITTYIGIDLNKRVILWNKKCFLKVQFSLVLFYIAKDLEAELRFLKLLESTINISHFISEKQ